MVRPTKKKTNLLCIDAGYSRKEAFRKSIGSKSVTEVINAYMDSVTEEHEKKIKLMELSKSPIKSVAAISTDNKSKQTTLDKYFNFWILDYDNWEQRQQIFNSLDDKQRLEVMIALNTTTRAWSTLQRSKELGRK